MPCRGGFGGRNSGRHSLGYRIGYINNFFVALYDQRIPPNGFTRLCYLSNPPLPPLPLDEGPSVVVNSSISKAFPEKVCEKNQESSVSVVSSLEAVIVAL